MVCKRDWILPSYIIFSAVCFVSSCFRRDLHFSFSFSIFLISDSCSRCFLKRSVFNLVISLWVSSSSFTLLLSSLVVVFLNCIIWFKYSSLSRTFVFSPLSSISFVISVKDSWYCSTSPCRTSTFPFISWSSSFFAVNSSSNFWVASIVDSVSVLILSTTSLLLTPFCLISSLNLSNRLRSVSVLSFTNSFMDSRCSFFISSFAILFSFCFVIKRSISNCLVFILSCKACILFSHSSFSFSQEYASRRLSILFLKDESDLSSYLFLNISSYMVDK